MGDVLKKICTALLLVIIFSLLSEVVDIFGFSRFQPRAAIVLSSNEAMLTWNRLPYWAFYEVEVLNRSPEVSSSSETQVRRLMHFTTWKHSLIIAQYFPFRTFWRVSGCGISQRPLRKCSDLVRLGDSTAEAATKFVQPKSHETNKIKPEQMNCW